MVGQFIVPLKGEVETLRQPQGRLYNLHPLQTLTLRVERLRAPRTTLPAQRARPGGESVMQPSEASRMYRALGAWARWAKALREAAVVARGEGHFAEGFREVVAEVAEFRRNLR